MARTLSEDARMSTSGRLLIVVVRDLLETNLVDGSESSAESHGETNHGDSGDKEGWVSCRQVDTIDERGGGGEIYSR